MSKAAVAMFNAGGDAVDFGLPPAPLGVRWRLAVDTSTERQEGYSQRGDEPALRRPLSPTTYLRDLAPFLIARQAEIK